jgi:hypothetical protein
VIHAIREAVGVKNAQKALFSLPTPGRLLVSSQAGAWVVEQNGSKRLLGPYREASWSPFGRFVVALKGDEMVTMEPNGKVHWTLARPGIGLPAWGGRHDDTRIAYLSSRNLHVIAGDGSGDAARCAHSVARVEPAWQPGSLSILAFAAKDRVAVYDVTGCRQLFARTTPTPRRLEWSSDGKLLLVVSGIGADVYDLDGKVVAERTGVSDAAFIGRTHTLAVLRGADVYDLESQPLFHADGLRQLVSSPDGRWLLLTWPAANQWVFVRVASPHTIRAFSGISGQFGGGKFPVVAGWVGK